MDASLARNLRNAIENAENLLIVAHKNPDGDAMGSSLGLCNFLKFKFIKSTVIVPDTFPGFLRFLPGSKDVLFHDLQKNKVNAIVAKADVIICLDFNSLKRIEELGEEVKKSKAIKIMVDHHPFPEDFAQMMHHRTEVSSTSELVFELCTTLFPEIKMNQEAATCLYTGILTDTGSFRFAVWENTHEVTGKLIRAGADIALVNQNIFNSNSLNRMRLLGYALFEKLTVSEEFKTAYIPLSQEELKRFDHKKGDTEGFVNQALAIENINMAVIFTEQNEKLTKLSFRSSGNFEVNGFANKFFEGGGHKNAAGGVFRGPLTAALAKFEEVLPEIKTFNTSFV